MRYINRQEQSSTKAFAVHVAPSVKASEGGGKGNDGPLIAGHNKERHYVIELPSGDDTCRYRAKERRR